jgi:hypothetical protein
MRPFFFPLFGVLAIVGLTIRLFLLGSGASPRTRIIVRLMIVVVTMLIVGAMIFIRRH